MNLTNSPIFTKNAHKCRVYFICPTDSGVGIRKKYGVCAGRTRFLVIGRESSFLRVLFKNIVLLRNRHADYS